MYILQCADGTLYTGVTRDIERRLRQHNGEIVGGSRYTKSRRPVQVLWHEPAQNRSVAQQREAEIKTLSRKEKFLLTRC